MIRRTAFLVITALSALLASHVSAPSGVVEKLRPSATPTSTPKHAQREPRWPIVYPRLLKRGATWTPLWVLPTLAPRAGQ